jgi:hypothetical protein
MALQRYAVEGYYLNPGENENDHLAHVLTTNVEASSTSEAGDKALPRGARWARSSPTSVRAI